MSIDLTTWNTWQKVILCLLTHLTSFHCLEIQISFFHSSFFVEIQRTLSVVKLMTSINKLLLSPKSNLWALLKFYHKECFFWMYNEDLFPIRHCVLSLSQDKNLFTHQAIFLVWHITWWNYPITFSHKFHK